MFSFPATTVLPVYMGDSLTTFLTAVHDRDHYRNVLSDARDSNCLSTVWSSVDDTMTVAIWIVSCLWQWLSKHCPVSCRLQWLTKDYSVSCPCLSTVMSTATNHAVSTVQEVYRQVSRGRALVQRPVTTCGPAFRRGQPQFSREATLPIS